MNDTPKLELLERENLALKKANAELKAELDFLKNNPGIQAGIMGEMLVCDLLKAELTPYAESFDITAGKCKIEVKYSRLGVPDRRSPTRRWSWGKPLGFRDKGKDFDYLLLIGDKDHRFPEQYPDATPYVWFLIPRQEVAPLMFKGGTIGGIIQLTTKFKAVSNQKSKMLLKYLVRQEEILARIQNA